MCVCLEVPENVEVLAKGAALVSIPVWDYLRALISTGHFADRRNLRQVGPKGVADFVQVIQEDQGEVEEIVR